MMVLTSKGNQIGRWHALSIAQILQFLEADAHNGITPNEALRRMHQWGPNELPAHKGPGFIQMFFDQFKDIMVLVLLGATVVSALLGEYVDALTIITIVLLNAALGLFQEFRAERSLEMLKELAAPKAIVVRGGQTATIEAREIVPGDLVKISQGDRIPADLRLLESYSLEIDESALTGESLPVSKSHTAKVAPGSLVGDRRNILHMGTVATRGRGIGIAVGTGPNTEIGKIATLIHEAQDEPTPLQKRLAHLGVWLVRACLVVCLLVFFLGIAQGKDWTEMFLTGVSLAVAAIPEGLPAVVTISLALGVQRMIKRKAIVRKLSAVETLGCTTVICSDKTGTLTKNEMTATSLWSPESGDFLATGEGYNPKGKITTLHGQSVNLTEHRTLWKLVEVLSICNNAELVQAQHKGTLISKIRANSGQWTIQGDPTEGALLVLAQKAGFDYQKYREQHKIAGEIPFDSERKMMSVLVENPGKGVVMLSKGALDVLLDKSSYYLTAAGPVALDRKMKEQIRARAESLSATGLRVLAGAYREISEVRATDELEKDLVLIGLVGMVDPPRPEVVKAVSMAKKAGIRTYMVTGDHKLTAVSIGRQIGLLSGGWEEALTGRELEELDDNRLQMMLDRVRVFARVSPEHKIRLVRLLRKSGEVVAMTGDGVNDAPAIREADIGVAMGQSGTDVAKEASAMVLSDDNYATIVAAIEEGRGIYENIRKFIRYLLGCNTGEVMTMLLAAVLDLPLPLVAVQILLMNLVTDGLPAIALSLDPVNPRIMQRPPRRIDDGIFSGGMLKTILIQGALIALGTVGVFIYSLVSGTPLDTARTMAFSTLVISQLLYVFRCRGADSRGFFADLVSNLYLTVAVVASLAMHILVLTHPVLQKAFQVTGLSAFDWGIILAVAFFVSWLEDLVIEAAISLKRNIRKVLGAA